jgi:Domain of unknown function (DUF4386)
MSTDTSVQTTYNDPAEPSGRTSTDRFRDHVLAGATVLGPALVIVGLLLEVEDGNDDSTGAETLDAIAPHVDRFYAAELISAIGLVLLAAGALAVMRLVRGRGGVLATVGGLLGMIGGPAAATGIFMYGAVLSLAASDDLDRTAMGAFQDKADEAAQIFPPFAIGFIGSTLGFLFLAAALWRSRRLPIWVPIAMVVSAVVFFVGESGTVQAVAMVPLLAAYGVVARELVRGS